MSIFVLGTYTGETPKLCFSIKYEYSKYVLVLNINSSF